MEPQSYCRKWFSSANPPKKPLKDYSDVVTIVEPDQAYSIREIFLMSQLNQTSQMRIYDEYDDSEEGANYEFGTDQFEYRQMLLDAKRAKLKLKPDPEPVPDFEPDPDPDSNTA